MTEPRLLIVGGGLAGLSAGIYARHNGWQTTVVEHNLALGGVCAAWQRGPYLVDGCIHWLTGGPFARIYEELGVLPAVKLRVLERFAAIEDRASGMKVDVTRDLDELFAELMAKAPEDREELERIRRTAPAVASTFAAPTSAPELWGLRESLRNLWDMRDNAGVLAHFHKPVGQYLRDHINSERVRRFFLALMPESAPAIMLLWLLGYLEKGYLSRPVGGTEAFRARIAESYRERGGEVLLHATVDEILVDDHDRAHGLRLDDGTILDGDAVVCTSSAPETVLRLLGGRYDAALYRERMDTWKMFTPLVMVSLGVAQPYADKASTLVVDGLAPPVSIGGRDNARLTVRVYNDDPAFAPAGHTVVQALFESDYEWWAKTGTRYHVEKDAAADKAIDVLAPFFPDLRASVRMIDVATPLTFWKQARSWRGAYEGWVPSSVSMFGHVRKTLHGLSRFVMAGQWVEPGGGVPTAVLSGRQAIEILCDELGMPFTAPPVAPRADSALSPAAPAPAE